MLAHKRKEIKKKGKKKLKEREKNLTFSFKRIKPNIFLGTYFFMFTGNEKE